MKVRLQALINQLTGRNSAGLAGANLQSFRRNRVALLTALANALNKGIGMVLILAAISWTLPYLGETLTGAWLTIISLVTVLAFMDMGLGNAMTNQAARALVAGPDELKQEISTGLLLIVALAMVVTLLTYLLAAYAPWQLLFKLPQQSSNEDYQHIGLALKVFSGLFGLQILANGLIKTMVGIQKAHLAYSLQAALGLAALLALFGLTQLEFEIAFLLACIMAPPILTGVFIAWSLSRRGAFSIKTGFSCLSSRWKKFMGLGGYFFLLQLFATLGWGADALIVSSTLGVAAVAPFVLCQRLFQFASQPVAILSAPLWPAYADAHATGDQPYIRRLFFRSMLMAAAVGSLLILPIVIFSPALFALLVENEITVPKSLVIVYAVWVMLEIFGTTFAMFLNGMGIVRIQALLAGLYVLTSLPAKFWLVQTWGLEGLVAVSIVLYSIFTIVPYLYLFGFHPKYKKLLK